MPVNAYNGTAFVESSPKYYDGAAWQDVTVKQYDGTAWNTISTPTAVVGETGRVSLTDTIDSGVTASVSFSKTYTNPVVVAMINTRNGGQTVGCRVKDLTASGCTLFVEEPDNQGHNGETVSYLVMEAGSHTTPEGVHIEAGVHTTATVRVSGGSTTAGETVSFGSAFGATPAVLATLNTYANSAYMGTQVNSVGTSSFKTSQEAMETGIAGTTEDIGWVAIETGSGTLNGSTYEVGRGADGSNDGDDNTPHTITFSQSYGSTPDAVCHGQTMNGADGFLTRGAGTYNTTTQDLYATEDQVTNTERGHADETFGWFVIAPNAQIVA